MKKSIQIIQSGLESSSFDTPEFLEFVSTFKKEFTKELKSVGATDINFRKGHFEVRGNYTIGTQAWYFTTSDVRGVFPIHGIKGVPFMYRKCRDYNDTTGGSNQWVALGEGMGKIMHGG